MKGFSTALPGAVAVLTLAAACSETEGMPNVAYDDRWGDSTTMDIYLPGGGGDARPAVLLIHGGGWRMGSKDMYTRAAQRFAAMGYVAATANYRLVPEGQFPAAVKDCICALAYLRQHAQDLGIDPDRIALQGYSAGGHLVSLLGVAADHPELAPDCAAGTTWLPSAVIAGAGPQDLRDADNDIVGEFLGGSASEIPEVYALASPITHVRPGLPPFLFVHAEGDWFVDVDETTAMRDALAAAGNETRLLVIEGGGHILNPEGDPGHLYGEAADNSPEAWLVIADFLAQTIGRP